MYLRYNAIVFAIALAGLALISAANTMVYLAGDWNGSAGSRAAQWQARERGIAAVAVTAQPEMKFTRARWLYPDLETAVFGSSRVYALGSRMLGPNVYNFGISDNSAAAAIGQARYVLDQSPKLRTVYFNVDWATGVPFPDYPIQTVAGYPAKRLDRYAVLHAIRDSLNLPRVKNLASLVIADLQRETGPSLLRQMLVFGDTFTEQVCADGLKQANFGDPIVAGCPGFQDDGSTDFRYMAPLTNQSARSLMALALSGGLPFIKNLAANDGHPRALYLEALAALAENLKARGGRLIPVIPPLMPHLEEQIAALPGAREHLITFKTAMAQWAEANGVRLMDAGASERSGCVVSEFVDTHHARPVCWERVLARWAS